MNQIESIEKRIAESQIPSKIGKSYEITKLHGDASARSYYRLSRSSDSFMLMVLPANQPTSMAEEITKTKKAITKMPFLEMLDHLAAKGVKVPQLIVSDLDHHMILLEDFGDELLLTAIGRTGSNEEKLYKLALDELKTLSTITDKDPKDSIAFSREFDAELYMWEFIHFVEYGLDHQIKDFKGSDRGKIVSEFEKITQKYLSWPKVLCHRDYHSRNVIMLPQGGVGVIDFQDALLGPLYYDLVSLLKDAYHELKRPTQQSLAMYYKDKLGNTLSNDEFMYNFDLMSLHRNLKAAGRFCYIDIVKKNPNYLKDVPRSLAYVKTTCESHSELKNLKTVLFPYIDTLMEKYSK
ncbi:MAG: phosphotransferase [Proteobacteria bacterium]|jgi:aminoglycoside/choline kinase family phosphotransferase|nr:phosphotransferase [Pseudomonadota bacterium]